MKTLYVCRANFARSQMAEALHNKFFNSEAISAGTMPGTYEGTKFGEYGPKIGLTRCLMDIGIDIREKAPKKLIPEMIKESDRVIVMAEPRTWPDFLKTSDKITYWKVKDPGGCSIETYREARDEIKQRIEEMLK